MKSVPVEKWRGEFIDKFCNDHNGEIRFLRGIFYDEKDGAESIMEFISQAIQAARIEVKVDRDDSWRAFLQKLAWKKEEIDDATEWVDRTPLRLRSNHSLESIINKHQ